MKQTEEKKRFRHSTISIVVIRLLIFFSSLQSIQLVMRVKSNRRQTMMQIKKKEVNKSDYHDIDFKIVAIEHWNEIKTLSINSLASRFCLLISIYFSNSLCNRSTNWMYVIDFLYFFSNQCVCIKTSWLKMIKHLWIFCVLNSIQAHWNKHKW